MERTCFEPMAVQCRQAAESRAHSATSHKTDAITQHVMVGVTVHLDIPFRTVSDRTSAFDNVVAYASHIVSTLNEGFNNTTPEFLRWSNMSAQDIMLESGMTMYKSQKLYDQLNDPVVGTSDMFFVLRGVHYNSSQTQAIIVDPRNGANVRALKVGRWPRDPATMNVWVTTLGQDILGFATFPFTSEPRETYGVVVDYRSTHPSLGFTEYGLNRTIVHEVGHCFGLFHTFTDPNAPLPSAHMTDDNDEVGERNGDGIKDTPRQAFPTFGNTLLTSSSDADIAFVNTMNYTQDASSLGFTKEQVERMRYFLQHDVQDYITDMNLTDEPPTAGASSVAVVDQALNHDDTSKSNIRWQITSIIFIVLSVALAIVLAYIVTRNKN